MLVFHYFVPFNDKIFFCLQRPLSYGSIGDAVKIVKGETGVSYGKVTHVKGASIRNIIMAADGIGMREETRAFGRYSRTASAFDHNYAIDIPQGPMIAGSHT